jgi:hypothetical protein
MPEDTTPAQDGARVESDERHFQLYFEVLREWGKPEDLKRILRRYSPEELEKVLRAIGSPEEAERLIKAVKERAEDWEWARTSKQKFFAATKLLIAVGAAVAILRPMVLRLLDLWSG